MVAEPATKKTPFLDPRQCRFEQNGQNELILHLAEGESRTIGALASAFPLTRPATYVQLWDDAGNLIGMLPSLKPLSEEARVLVLAELEKYYFLPKIERVIAISERLQVYTWQVETDRGARTFEVRWPRRNVRRVDRTRLVIRDVDGNRYELPDIARLSKDEQQEVLENT